MEAGNENNLYNKPLRKRQRLPARALMHTYIAGEIGARETPHRFVEFYSPRQRSRIRRVGNPPAASDAMGVESISNQNAAYTLF